MSDECLKLHTEHVRCGLSAVTLAADQLQSIARSISLADSNGSEMLIDGFTLGRPADTLKVACDSVQGSCDWLEKQEVKYEQKDKEKSQGLVVEAA